MLGNKTVLWSSPSDFSRDADCSGADIFASPDLYVMFRKVSTVDTTSEYI